MEQELSPSDRAQRAAVERDRAKIKVTLIPGTWAYGFFRSRSNLYLPANPPRWFEAGSGFRSSLESELQRMGFDFSIEVLQWDGANSVRSRASQAEILAKKLTSQRYPGLRQVIIAHSHGGSIACRAASLVEMSDEDLAVVTLSTPFLQASSRHEDSPRLIVDLLFILLGFFGVEAFVAKMGPSRLGLGLRTLGVCVLVVGYFWYKWKADEKIADLINTRVIPSIRLLVIRGFSDEASNSLVLGSVGAGLMNVMYYVLAFPMRWFMGAKWRVIAMLICFLGIVVLAVKTAAMIFKIISIWTVIGWMVALATIPLVIAGVFASVFGRELFFESLSLLFTVDSVPDCARNTDVVTLSATQTSVRGLRHGIYARAGCPRLIAYWLATKQTWHYLNDVPYSVE